MKPFHERVRTGESLTGTMVTVFSHPDLVDLLQIAGFDYLIVDCEHSAFSYESVAALLGRARVLGMPALVRVPGALREPVLKLMEAGAKGLLLPDTDTAQKAKELVRFAKYAPMGERGVSLLRPHTGYRAVSDPASYMQSANEETVLMAQIESGEGVANLKEILEVEGIDAAFVGPNDLSQSLGIPGQYQDPRFQQAIDSIIQSARQAGKVSGIHWTGSPAELAAFQKRGMTLNLWSNDIGMILNAGKSGLRQLKEAAEQ